VSGVHLFFEPGFFGDGPVRLALVLGGAVAVVSGLVGVLTVVRGQSFAGHAVADVGAAGGSGAFLLGLSPLWGFVVLGLAAAGSMELLGLRRARSRDVATGVVLGAALGLAALFLYFDASFTSTTGVTMTVLFGSIFAVSPPIVPVAAAFAAAATATVVALYRPLLLTSVSDELAASRGVRVRMVGLAYLLAMAVAVSLSCLTIGAILSTALLIGPAATALRLTRRPGRAMLVAAGLGVLAVWLGILLAYDSYYWPPTGRGWPVSFFVVALIFLPYVATSLRVARRRHTGRH
jgi:zinc/manganese transport system permease protein